jgi:cytochrome c peroxidase
LSRRARAGLVLCALLSLAPLVRGEDNPDPSRADKAALGRLLFFDKRLSRDGTVSCATCHDPRKGWTDRLPVSVGVGSKKGKRNAQTILNAVKYYRVGAGHSLFWDGRASSLEEQAIHPLINPEEMATTKDAVVKTLVSITGYRPYFRRAFGTDAVDVERVGRAIAEFEKTLVSMDAPYDRWDAGDPTAISTDAAAGFKLFIGKGTCTACHSSALFSDVDFHNIGVGQDKKPPDMGRFEVTKEDRGRGAYRTPTLRNLRFTAPYMHDGSLKTLAEVVDFYDKGGIENEWLDPDIQPLHLTPQEKRQLLAFMEALNSDPLESDPPKEFPR